MLYDVVKADYIKDYKVKVEFEDGHSGIVDFAPYLQKGGVFDRFSDLSFFKRFSVSETLGTIVWDNQIDVAPETLYEKCEPYSTANGQSPPLSVLLKEMKDDGHIHNRVLSNRVHRVMNGIFGAVVWFTVGATGWQHFADKPVLGEIFHWFTYLAIPFGIVMLFVNPKKVSIVEGHTSPDIAYDELTEKDKEANQASAPQG